MGITRALRELTGEAAGASVIANWCEEHAYALHAGRMPRNATSASQKLAQTSSSGSSKRSHEPVAGTAADVSESIDDDDVALEPKEDCVRKPFQDLLAVSPVATP